MKNKNCKIITYYYRGLVEHTSSSRGYVWKEGYSPSGPNGEVQYPWLTKKEAREDAKAQGAKAVFMTKKVSDEQNQK